ncbi:MAG: hypothetical protein AAFY41_11480 [Bacteroidota bacterium]
MKRFLCLFFMFVSLGSIAQGRPAPFSEARKAIASIENEPKIRDSLKRCYKKRWLLDFHYGQKFISASNQTAKPDTITLTDFTQKRGFFGVGGSYFLKDKLLIGGAISFLILPREQEINSFSGSGGSGTGSGGLSINFELFGKYYFREWGFTRPYVSVGFGRYQLIAKGGSVEFSFSSGQSQDIGELNAQVPAASISSGISHRLAPGSMLDLKVGYTITPKTDPIGGITSPGGISTSLTLSFILNPKGKDK